MATKQEYTAKYKLDLSEFKQNMSDANQQIRMANAEFKNATAGMKDWEKTTEGQQAKIKQLTSIMEAQKQKLANYRKEIEFTEKAYASNEKRAAELRKEMQELADKGIDKTSKEYAELEQELKIIEDQQGKNKKTLNDLNVSIQNQEAALKRTEAELTDYEKNTKQAEERTEKFKETAEKVGKAVAAAFAAASAAIGVALKKSIEAGMEFDKGMSQVAATMGYSMTELNDSSSEAAQTFGELREFAQEMGRTTAYSATEASEALNFMALAGYDAQESMEMLPTVLNLAAAGGIDLAKASDMITDAQSALGLTIEQTTTMTDQMAAAAANSNTSVEQLGDAILTVGATAKNVKGGTAELSTVLGVLADNGIKGAEGGTHIRNILLAMNPQTEKAAAAFDKLGLKAYDADGNMRSLPDIFHDMREGMKGMTQEAKDAMLKGMFNKTDLASVNALLNTTDERFEELYKDIEGSAGAAKDMAEVQLDNLAGDVTLFKSALEGAEIAIADGLNPTLRDFVKFGTKGLSDITDALKSDGIRGAASVFGDYLADGIKMIAEKVPEFVETAGSLIKSFVGGVVKALPQFAEALPEIIKSLISLLMDLTKALVDALPDIISSLLSAVFDLLTDVEFWTGLATAVVDLAGGIIMGVAEGIGKSIGKIAEKAFGDDSISKMYEAIEVAEEFNDRVQESKKKIDELAEKRDDSFAEIEAKVAIYETIKDKLDQYTDSMGKVKEGYEDEMTALQALADEYGIKIEVRNGYVQSYKDLIGIIDDTIESYQKEAYAAAETGLLEEAYKEKIQFERDYNSAMEGFRQAQMDGNREAQQEYLKAAEAAQQGALRAQENITISSANMVKIQEGHFNSLATSLRDINSRTLSDMDIVQGESIKRLIDNGTDFARYTASWGEDFYALTIDQQNMIAAAWISSGDDIKAEINKTYPEIQTFMADYYSGYVDTVTTQSQAATAALSSEAAKQEEREQRKYKTMKKDAKSGMKEVKEETEKGADAAVKVIENKAEEAEAAGRQIPHSTAEGVESEADRMEESVQYMVDNALNINVYDEAYSVGSNMGAGVNDGLGSWLFTIGQTAGNIIGDAVQRMKEEAGIASPAKETKKIANFMGEGLIVGFKDILPRILEAFGGGTDDMIGALDLSGAKANLSGLSSRITAGGGLAAANGAPITGGATYNFYQTNNSPEAISRADIYRDTKTLLKTQKLMEG